MIWTALFIDEFHFPGWEVFAERDDVDELHERNRKKFEQTIPEYPMLARIFDTYEDYRFTPEEIPRLSEECLRAKSKVTNLNAVKALRKLIVACDEAFKRGYNLTFICD